MWTADSRCKASDSHRDEAVATGIQKGLHRIARRVGQLNALRVFRDTTELSANPKLVGQDRVTDAMDRSRYLIVVLSHARRDLSGSTGRSATGWSTEDRTRC